MSQLESQQQARRQPMIFLAGPPGAGKTSLGSRFCQEHQLRFLDIAQVAGPGREGDTSAHLAILKKAVNQRDADMVELPWALQLRRGTWALARQAGLLVGMWAHPVDMQARCGLAQPQVTKQQGVTGRGGFGRLGTRCPEFRCMERACPMVLMLVGYSLAEAYAQLCEAVTNLGLEESVAPVERAGMGDWAKDWQESYGANVAATEILADAMARFVLYLEGKGGSPRKMAGVRSDLYALGMLAMCYEDPSADEALSSISGGPLEYQFRRKFTDSDRAVARFLRTSEQFREFLRDAGMVST